MARNPLTGQTTVPLYPARQPGSFPSPPLHPANPNLGGAPPPNSGGGGDDSGVNPFLAAAKALAAQQLAELNGLLQKNAAAVALQLGDPSVASAYSNYLNLPGGLGNQINAANTAGLTTLAQLGNKYVNGPLSQAHTIINNLAAHGILNSGDTGFLEGQNQHDYGVAQFGARQAAQNQLSTLVSNYVAQRDAIQQNLINAELGLLSNPNALLSGGGGGSTTQPAAAAPVTTQIAHTPVPVGIGTGYDYGTAGRPAARPVAFAGGARIS